MSTEIRPKKKKKAVDVYVKGSEACLEIVLNTSGFIIAEVIYI